MGPYIACAVPGMPYYLRTAFARPLVDTYQHTYYNTCMRACAHACMDIPKHFCCWCPYTTLHETSHLLPPTPTLPPFSLLHCILEGGHRDFLAVAGHTIHLTPTYTPFPNTATFWAFYRRQDRPSPYMPAFDLLGLLYLLLLVCGGIFFHWVFPLLVPLSALLYHTCGMVLFYTTCRILHGLYPPFMPACHCL